ncbi:MAG: immunoglobulin domain-containing protein [Verrucomicrobia bacterium]|nr:immunoglobulin domain-containing protein [Verrucomicrobiota bacterium]
MKKILSIGAVTALATVWAHSTILLNDSFSYTNGPLVTVSGGKWIHHSPSGSATGEVAVASEQIILNRSNAEDVSALLAGQPYSSAGTTNIFYASFTVRFTTLPSAGGNYFAHFKDAGASSGFGARVWAFTSAAAPGMFRLGISSTSSTIISATNPTDLALNTDYQVVTRLVNSNSIATLWINPASESDPSISSAEAPATVTVATYAFREDSGIGVMSIDDLRVGTTFAEVLTNTSPSPPTILTQLQSQTVTEGGTAMFSVVADGTAPLSYQWKFGGTNLTSETNSSLTLFSVTTNHAGDYIAYVTNSVGWTNSQPATLTVNPRSSSNGFAFSLLTYNVRGNGATNWSTNSPQVQAIGRQMQYLTPDIITFNEIPWDFRYEMTNFITAFLPGYHLAISSGTDGFICSAIASRYSITRSNKWLDGADLKPFGYTNTSTANADNFTRDLFEAQIDVPGFNRPLHIFTTHLKATGTNYSDSAAKRAAEAAAITNFFATNLFVLYPYDPYTLSGDMNESDTNALAIQRLLSAPTGLRLTNPTNPFTGSFNTYSTATANPGERIDYILPGNLLFTNIAGGQVFRTDKLNPVPPNLNSNDDKVASDHLPVMMVFNNPYLTPFQIVSINVSNQLVTLNWEAISNRQYRVDVSSNLVDWVSLADSQTATGTNFVFSTNVTDSPQFFRVLRLP